MMFAVMFIVMLVATMTFTAKDTNDDIDSKSNAVAWQMSAWHRAAVDKCIYSMCVSGVISPYSNLNEALRGGQAFTNGSFITVHDPSTKTLLTYLAGNYQRAGITSASVSGALSKTLLGPSNEVGVFDGSIIVPFRPYWLVYSPNDPVSVPHPIPLNNPFAGQTIPKGVPVIMSRLCDFMPVTSCS